MVVLSIAARRCLQRNSFATTRRFLMTLPSFSLEGKTCVVTGAARGLGKEFLTAFALSGARGACIDLSLEAGDKAIQHISQRAFSQSSTASYKPDLRAYACDVTSEAHVKDTWEAIVKDFGQVDVMVTAAGIVDNVEASCSREKLGDTGLNRRRREI
ncbi:hypothetical protein ONS95_001664 [Cadophora gregata]|uniref:uncharacterized protein n=1 Tax=Cadophora gregata TaxID=51156 RepID=UPI0026DB27ED|nr:uncharacterized protein ONS95_001664 [Cadophora gregata]KAK0111293.1 hypothetical protein ONS95_001664 [Cadophora gregata]KAK0112236.1 hypothetical protein ONS96_001484 [Cadophora gregata f. sp. sojae]